VLRATLVLRAPDTVIALAALLCSHIVQRDGLGPLMKPRRLRQQKHFVQQKKHYVMFPPARNKFVVVVVVC
jgi:hypothetical protein